jgi:hypothetical protein
MNADIGLRGPDLLDAVIDQIEQYPISWNQSTWRCETGMCVAGWAAELAGGTWLTRADNEDSAELLAADPDDTPSYVFEHTSGAMCITASNRAARLLGIEDDDRELFDGNNSLNTIKDIRDELRAGN